MEATIQSNYKEEIRMLSVKVDMLENELKLANDRADKAENDVADLKKLSFIKYHLDNMGTLYQDNLIPFAPTPKQLTEAQETQQPIPTQPPPPPPPMPKFNLPHTNITKNGTSSLNDSIAAFEFKMGNDNIHNQHVQATGRWYRSGVIYIIYTYNVLKYTCFGVVVSPLRHTIFFIIFHPLIHSFICHLNAKNFFFVPNVNH